ncbi:ABC transporter substrate-binding protein [Phytohalomonas tamaricis]|uniref:ABC transporter substrate-binding protein n=1 Tax=Phytohalomonas tamaricis TaxID=2081032 RepID=UPI000D0AF9A6|nr:ABC transporter substrate-binding protein [Phytohalomonas tamaricis]
MRRFWKGSALALLSATTLFAHAASAQTLTIGLAEDPDQLDPDRARSYVGRIVFTGMCDKLVDLDDKLNIVPQLATEWSWNDDQTVLTMTLRDGVTFHDGTPFNAEAVKYNIERSLNLPGSNRRNEISAVDHVEVVDGHTVKLHLKQPFAPLLAALSDRAGMMISPKAAEEEGENFSRNPVCSGPFKFVDRVAQDKITLEKYAGYWNKDAIHLDRVIYRPIPDATVRLANLQSGQLDIIDRAATSDLKQIRDDSSLKLESAVSLGYSGITINTDHGPRADNPLGSDPRVREAFELSIDRNIINQVAYDGEFTPDNQPISTQSPFHAHSLKSPVRDVERAKALLKEAGVDRVSIDLMATNSPEVMRVAQIIQSMAGQAGFDVKVTATEFATMLDSYDRGDFQAGLLNWSGRADPDGNLYAFLTCDGTLNDGEYCNAKLDEQLNKARRTNDTAARHEAYEAAERILLTDRPIIYLYHPNWFWGLSKRVEGFKPYPDGMIRLTNVSLGS